MLQWSILQPAWWSSLAYYYQQTFYNDFTSAFVFPFFRDIVCIKYDGVVYIHTLR